MVKLAGATAPDDVAISGVIAFEVHAMFSCLVRVQKYVVARNLILKLGTRHTGLFKRQMVLKGMFTVKAVPSSALFLVGSMDWLTTIVGIACFGAVESNPFIAGITGASLIAFTVIKLLTTVFIGLLFYQGERMLLGTPDKSSRSFQYMRIMLRGACVAATGFLLFAVVNNLIVVASAI